MAASEEAVRADLRRQGVVPSRIKKQSQGLFSGGGKVTPADIAIFMRQLATMLAAGIPLVQSFEIVGNGHENAAMQKLIMSIKADVEGFEPFVIRGAARILAENPGCGILMEHNPSDEETMLLRTLISQGYQLGWVGHDAKSRVVFQSLGKAHWIVGGGVATLVRVGDVLRVVAVVGGVSRLNTHVAHRLLAIL